MLANIDSASEIASRPNQVLRFRNLAWLFLPFLLWWALRDVSIHQVWQTLGQLSPTGLLALAGINIAILCLFSSRWWLILRNQGYRLPYFSLVGYRLAAFGVTYFTPGPQLGGEPLQVYLLHRRQRVPLDTAVSSVTLDKLLELLANFTFLLLGVSTVLASGYWSGPGRFQAVIGAVLLLAGPAGYLLALYWGKHPVSWMLARITRLAGRGRLWAKFQALSAAAETQAAEFCRQHPAALLKAMLLSALVWVGLIAEFGLALRFFGLDLDLSQVVVVLTAARVAFLLPVPAGLGALEAGQVLAMQALGINPAVGIGLSLLIRSRDIIFGGLGLWWGGLQSR